MISFTNRAQPSNTDTAHTATPTEVKVEVWKSDGGRCVLCGAEENLHFDHIAPCPKGGSSLAELNVELLCAGHNLEIRQDQEDGTRANNSSAYELGRIRPTEEPSAKQSSSSQITSAPTPAVGIPMNCPVELKAAPPLFP